MKLHQHLFGNGKPLCCNAWAKPRRCAYIYIYIYIYTVYIYYIYILYIPTWHMLGGWTNYTEWYWPWKNFQPTGDCCTWRHTTNVESGWEEKLRAICQTGWWQDWQTWLPLGVGHCIYHYIIHQVYYIFRYIYIYITYIYNIKYKYI